MAPTVLLLHGLLMRRPALLPMALRLRRRGFTPRLFGYSTLWREPEQAVESLARRLRDLGPEPVHVLAHSLGGLVAIETLCRHPDLPVRRLLCLGSPIGGSAAALALAQRRVGWIIGRARPLLCAGAPALPKGVEVAMVAGSRPIGLGRLFGHFQGEHDGTVAVSETRAPGLAGHAVIAASHSGLVLSAQAADLAAEFFRSGRLPDPRL